MAISCFLFHLTCVQLFKDCSWPIFLVTAYVLGGTCTHTVQILVHDVTHFTAFETVNYNRYLAILVNCVTGVPSAITFGK